MGVRIRQAGFFLLYKISYLGKERNRFKMKYALIGCGRIATNHIKAVINNQLEFVAACDLETTQIEKLLKKHGLEQEPKIRYYTDYKK
ncbi:MAG: hypothetical protein HFI30_08890, partial [Lachnospiraceae bacterium]|nr:hypothetical protein [Lachnospiraceae bacterium]